MKVKNTTRINPDNGNPYTGELLAASDPRAWENTLAFYGRLPSQEEVNAHFEYLERENLAHRDTAGNWHMNDNDAPVLYEFGIRWDNPEDLVPADSTDSRCSHDIVATLESWPGTSDDLAPEPVYMMVPGEGAPQFTFDMPEKPQQLSLL